MWCVWGGMCVGGEGEVYVHVCVASRALLVRVPGVFRECVWGGGERGGNLGLCAGGTWGWGAEGMCWVCQAGLSVCVCLSMCVFACLDMGAWVSVRECVRV